MSRTGEGKERKRNGEERGEINEDRHSVRTEGEKRKGGEGGENGKRREERREENMNGGETMKNEREKNLRKKRGGEERKREKRNVRIFFFCKSTYYFTTCNGTGGD